MRLKELRESKGLSQREFGLLFNVAQNTVSNWERGSREVPQELLIKMALYFDVTIDYLLSASDDPSPPTKKAQKKETPDEVSDDDMKFALFGGAAGEITDEMYQEVKTFADFIKIKYKDEIEKANKSDDD